VGEPSSFQWKEACQLLGLFRSLAFSDNGKGRKRISYLSLWKAVAWSEGTWSAREDKLEFIGSKTRGLVADRVRSHRGGNKSTETLEA
jgi:hypothetical protein